MIAHSVLFFIITVPRQLNGYDCGLYVCRYVAALHQSIDLCVTNDDLYSCSSPLLDKITCNEHFQFDQAVIPDFRIRLGILIDNLSGVYHFGKVPNRTQKSSAGKATKTYKAPKKKAVSKRTRSQKHKLIEGVEETQSKSYPFRGRHKSKAKLDHKVQILTEDLKSDSDSILDLLADPFIPSPQKKYNDGKLKVEQPLLPLYDQPIYSLTAEEAKEVEEVASNDPFTAAAELEYPLTAEEAKEVDEVAPNDPFTATANFERLYLE
jgi:hypothetical protein